MSDKPASANMFYLAMVLAFAGGMWAIMQFGSTLQAAPDLAGEWKWNSVGKTEDSLRAKIDQSGKFVGVQIENDPPVEFRLNSTDSNGINLKSRDATLTITRAGMNDLYRVQLAGSSRSGDYTGQLVTRQYPRPAAASQPIAPPAVPTVGH